MYDSISNLKYGKRDIMMNSCSLKLYYYENITGWVVDKLLTKTTSKQAFGTAHLRECSNPTLNLTTFDFVISVFEVRHIFVEIIERIE